MDEGTRMAELMESSGREAGGPPGWLAQALDAPILDVRPSLADGEDPLGLILDAAERVEFGGFLVIDAPFNPSPLRRVLAARGFSSYGRRLTSAHWRVFFHMDGGQDWERDAEIEMLPEGALTWSEEDGLHVDVRKLTPPLPMLAILRLIDGHPELAALVVHHERLPQFLIPELAERGWRVVRSTEDFADVRLWLEKAA
ncbi:DUF2249 domain-containing protein [Magnetospirillum sp. LM-5]|uniref:DUF2249 domain-containing protein n=1 Tax=Magnetospirillum sp. LM-5 TaxID=2681466 RepID=UPI0020C51256|nr:DUF2249 domain-containing protein [Magnetospirillum sp. LM-5]